jgi:FHS family glucose/mannose:H+ symporter-like MFS transporter
MENLGLALTAILGAFGYGVVVALLGSIKLRLAEERKLDDAQIGRLISVLSFTSLIMVVVVGILLDKFGHQPVIVIGSLITALAILLVAYVPSYGLLVASCILLGIGGMGFNTAANTLLVMRGVITPEGGAAASNLGNVFFGVGAMTVPALTAFLFRKYKYGPSVTVVAAILALPMIVALVSKFPPIEAGFDLNQFFKLLGETAVIIGGLALLCYIALEVSMAGWITTYLKSQGLEDARCSTTLSLFWVALLVARLIAGLLVLVRIPEAYHAWAIVVLAVLAMITIMIMITTRSKGAAAAAVIATGFWFGPIFPTTVGVTLARFPEALGGRVFGPIFAIGLIGGTIVPAAIGYYAKGKTIQKSLSILAVAALVLAIIGVVMAWTYPAGA